MVSHVLSDRTYSSLEIIGKRQRRSERTRQYPSSVSAVIMFSNVFLAEFGRRLKPTDKAMGEGE